MPQLFTIISIMIGLFGGSISTIIIMRNTCERRITENLKSADEMIRELQEIDCSADSLKQAGQSRDYIKNSGNSFTGVASAPSLLFLIWIFLTCLFIILSPDCRTLFKPAQSHNQKTETGTQEQTTPQLQWHELPPLQLAGNAISMLLVPLLFSKYTLGFVALVDLLCIHLARRLRKNVGRQYDKITTLHKTLTQEKGEAYKKMKTVPKEPSPQEAEGQQASEQAEQSTTA